MEEEYDSRYRSDPEAVIAMIKGYPPTLVRNGNYGDYFNSDVLNNEEVILGVLDEIDPKKLLKYGEVIEYIVGRWNNPNVMEKLASVITRNANEG